MSRNPKRMIEALSRAVRGDGEPSPGEELCQMCGRGGVMAARRHGPTGTYLRSKTPRWWRQRSDGGG